MIRGIKVIKVTITFDLRYKYTFSSRDPHNDILHFQFWNRISSGNFRYGRLLEPILDDFKNLPAINLTIVESICFFVQLFFISSFLFLDLVRDLRSNP